MSEHSSEQSKVEGKIRDRFMFHDTDLRGFYHDVEYVTVHKLGQATRIIWVLHQACHLDIFLKTQGEKNKTQEKTKQNSRIFPKKVEIRAN